MNVRIIPEEGETGVELSLDPSELGSALEVSKMLVRVGAGP